MRILVLNGSPRISGKTSRMINALKDGIKEEHTLIIKNVTRMNLHGCIACEHCHKEEKKKCVQKDDMQEIYEELKSTEMLVLASPIYYHNMSGQLKCVIDRFYAVLDPKDHEPLNKIALLLSSGDELMYDGTIFSYRGDFLEFLHLENKGIFTLCEKDDLENRLQEIKKWASTL